IGYTFASLPLAPRLGFKANIISGDEDPNDPDLQTFNPMFPKRKYFGELSLLGPENLINLHSTLDLNIADGWVLSGAAQLYWRESTGTAFMTSVELDPQRWRKRCAFHWDPGRGGAGLRV